MNRHRLVTRLAAHLVHASWIGDRAYHAVDRWRARLILALGSDAFFDAYNDVAYARDSTYRATSPQFRRGLFAWERRVVRDFFPPPPARVLVGAAGGGRESLGLAELGYRVTAFEPVITLAESLEATRGPAPIEVLVGRYDDLPALASIRDGSRVDLAVQPSFDAAILGWYSFSHGRSNARRLDALRRVVALCAGPIVVSYFPKPAPAESGGDQFSVQVGHYREISEREMRRFAEDAGLDILQLDPSGSEPAVLRRRPAR